MIFHTVDTSYKNLKSCTKRAKSYAKKGDFTGHQLEKISRNCFFFLDADVEDGIDYQFQLHVLDYLAKAIDDFLKMNLLCDDEKLQSILYEWKVRLSIDPLLLN